MQKTTINPMHPKNSSWKSALCLANATPRCGAKTRQGAQCQSPAMPNGRCRMHGGKAGAPKGERNGNYKHGSYSEEWLESDALYRSLMQKMKE